MGNFCLALNIKFRPRVRAPTLEVSLFLKMQYFKRDGAQLVPFSTI